MLNYKLVFILRTIVNTLVKYCLTRVFIVNWPNKSKPSHILMSSIAWHRYLSFAFYNFVKYYLTWICTAYCVNSLVSYYLTRRIKANNHIYSCQVPLDTGIYRLLFIILSSTAWHGYVLLIVLIALSVTTWHAQLQTLTYTQTYR